MLDAAERRRAGAAAVPGDHDVVGVGFGNARGDRSHAQLRDQLHAHGGARIDALQVVNQLRQIFDAVDVVMRRRTDQRDSGLRMPQARDQFANFVAGKLAAFAGLRALRDLDLQFLGVRQVFGGDAEASRGDLLDLVIVRREHAGECCRRAYTLRDLRRLHRYWSARLT